MDVCTKFHGHPSCICWDISVWNKMNEQQTASGAKNLSYSLRGIITDCDYSVDILHTVTLHWAENSSLHLKIRWGRFPLEQLETPEAPCLR